MNNKPINNGLIVLTFLLGLSLMILVTIVSLTVNNFLGAITIIVMLSTVILLTAFDYNRAGNYNVKNTEYELTLQREQLVYQHLKEKYDHLIAELKQLRQSLDDGDS
jgi:hypothetical protein